MSLGMIVMNVVLIVGVLGVIVGLCTWAVVTQHRDHGVVAEGPLFRRRIWSRRSRPHAGPVRPWIVRRGAVWPPADAAH
jgi:hypothetical protein